jgi:hypothetical protein
LSPTANDDAVARDLTRLHHSGLIEMWFKGGHANYRNAL